MKFGRSRLTILILGLAVLWMIFNAITLNRYPAVTCDESFYARTSLRFISTAGWPEAGRMFYLPHGRTYWFLLGLSLKLFGGGLFAARLISLLGLVGLSIAAYLTGYHYYDRRIALWAAALTGVSWLAVRTGHVARPDMLAAAAGGLIVAFLPVVRQVESPWLASLYGAALVLQLDLHFNQLHLLWPVSLFLLIEYIRTRRWSHSVLLMVGGLIGGLLVLWLHMGNGINTLMSGFISDPLGFITIYVDAGGGAVPSGGLLATLGLAAASFGRFWWNYYAWLAPVVSLPQAVLFLSGLLLGLFKGNTDQRRLGLIIVLSSLTYSIINARYQIIGYATIWLPLYFPLAAHAIDWLSKQVPILQLVDKEHRLATVFLSSFAALFIVGNLYLTFTHPARAYTNATADLTSRLPADATVLTDARWWFALKDHEFADELNLTPTNTGIWWNTVPASTLLDPLAPIEPNDLMRPGAADHAREVLSSIQPDYILDDGVLGCLTDPVPQSEILTAAAKSNCTPVETFAFPLYGSFTLYSCNW